MSPEIENKKLENVSKFLLESVGSVIKNKSSITFSKDPVILKKDIIEYDSFMQTFGMQKFNTTCLISSISFYLSEKKLTDHDALGSIILYLKEDLAERFLKSIGFDFKGDDDSMIFKGFGEFCKLLAEDLKNRLTSIGYKNLFLSTPINERNNIMPGVEFNYEQHSFYEISFHFWKEKALVAEVTMAPPV